MVFIDYNSVEFSIFNAALHLTHDFPQSYLVVVITHRLRQPFVNGQMLPLGGCHVWLYFLLVKTDEGFL